MSSPGSTVPKDDLIGQIWTICTTFTPEATAAASAKAAEIGLDPNRGVIPLKESFINLSAARSLLEDAIQKRKLIQLPLTVQKELLSDLEAISKSLQNLIMAGADEIVNLVTSIESLNTAIWKYGMHNLSDEVLGYQTKLNQLKNQELEIGKVTAELKVAQRVAHKINDSAAEIDQRRSEIAVVLENVKAADSNAAALLKQFQESENKINAILQTVQQNEKQSGELTSSIKASNNELLSLDASIRRFYGEVDEYTKKISETSKAAADLIANSEATIKTLTSTVEIQIKEAVDRANKSVGSALSELTTKAADLRADTESKTDKALSDLQQSSARLLTEAKEKLDELHTELNQRSEKTIQANHDKTAQIQSELDTLKDQIKAQIQQATGFALFGAFQTRQNQVATAKRIWAYVIMGLVAISVLVTIWIAYEAQQFTTHSLAFYVKLSLTIPLGFAITFCTVQYSRERRLEEEYAFKASISVSLNPYKDLVQSILKEDAKAELGKYTEFVIDSVKNVFTSPTDKVFEAEKKSKGLTEKAFKQVAEIIGTGVKAAKS